MFPNLNDQLPRSAYNLEELVKAHTGDVKDQVKERMLCPKCHQDFEETCLNCNISKFSRFHPVKYNSFSLQDLLQKIVERNFTCMQKYVKHLSQGLCDDVLSAGFFEEKQNNTHLRLLLSADGASFTPTKGDSIWPVQTVVLNLPPCKRQSFDNSILLTLWGGRGKPNWQMVIFDLKQQLEELELEILHEGEKIRFSVEIALCVCDLPALASITNTTQYNGKFDCVTKL